MMKRLKVNPVTGRLDLIGDLPELQTDPANPSTGDAWVLREGDTMQGTPIGILASITQGIVATDIENAGSPYGLLLLLTRPGNEASLTYTLSYKTRAGTIVRTTLS